MIEGNFFATMFYADVEGHPKDPPLARALEELEFFTQPGSLRILGVYPANAFRSTFREEKD
jgi:prephenate dehydratase